jgi:MFS family permease
MSSSTTMQNYEKNLSDKLKKIYKEIVAERTRIYYFGYVLGFVLAAVIILYNIQIKGMKMRWPIMVCITVAVAFITNYFYYILTPKTKWMLENIETPEETKAWLQMYRAMQTYYHGGLVFGIIAVGFAAFAFRC